MDAPERRSTPAIRKGRMHAAAARHALVRRRPARRSTLRPLPATEYGQARRFEYGSRPFANGYAGRLRDAEDLTGAGHLGFFASSRAFRTRSAVMGSSVTRAPTASATALAIAGATPLLVTSPTA